MRSAACSKLMLMSWPDSSFVAGVKIGSGSLSHCRRPGGSFTPQTVWDCWYSFQPDPARYPRATHSIGTTAAFFTKDDAGKIFEHPDDHAGEMETSFILAYYPHLVAKTPEGKLAADDGVAAMTRFEAVNRGWVSITRPWHLLTTNTGSGYPHAASAEKIHKMMPLLVDRLATFLVELSNARMDDKFPY